jgi:hypothetical protein
MTPVFGLMDALSAPGQLDAAETATVQMGNNNCPWLAAL